MALEIQRRGGKFEAAGFILILLGMAGCFGSALLGEGAFLFGLGSGAVLFAAGLITFLIGRFQ